MRSALSAADPAPCTFNTHTLRQWYYSEVVCYYLTRTWFQWFNFDMYLVLDVIININVLHGFVTITGLFVGLKSRWEILFSGGPNTLLS